MPDSRLRPKICPVCDQSFRGRAKRVYCSDECKYINKYPPKKNRVPKPGICVKCGVSYIGTRNKYCSDKCFGEACAARRQRARSSDLESNKRLVQKAKNRPCMDCGNSYPHYVMDLHHRDPADKVGAVSAMVSGSYSLLAAEVRKCDVLCSNCHRIRHHGKNFEDG